jgi:hypothetical protein
LRFIKVGSPRRGELPAQNEKKTKLKTAIQLAGFASMFN